MLTIAKVEKVKEDEYLITSPECPDCGEDITITADGRQMFAYHNGMLAQDVFPDLSPDERERFVSGVCPVCWELVFGAVE